MDTSGARVRVLPPLLFLVVLVVLLLVDRLVPLPLPGDAARVAVGVALVALGLALMLWAGWVMLGSHTTVNPWGSVSSLVTTGPFRFTRNPIYLADVLVYLGVTVWVGTWWPLFAFPLLVVTAQWLVIWPEERYLTQRFGGAYTAYRQRVRRWV